MKDSEKIIIEFVKLSKNREKVLKTLEGETLKPSDISKKTNIHRNNVSRTLSQLREKDLIRLLNPENKRGRLYELTEYGEKILNLMKSE
ncbi:MAG: winged helix-turn-helix domain-containing protein [Methanobrevibacter sp.]|nr:winged helix-turn-helix domain-containing protein [Methanobrevibacter sp.]